MLFLNCCFASIYFLFHTQSESIVDNYSLVQTNQILVDKFAENQAIRLFNFLRDSSKNGVMFGHQDDLAYGVGWQSERNRSDIKESCGQYPAVFGWDIGGVGKKHNLDGISFEDITILIREADKMGGIITISMHLDNPITGNDAWDNTPVVDQILPGGTHHEEYLATLKLVADFLNKQQNKQGQHIPIIFRPYHEHNQPWPWWGMTACSKDNFIALWRMTIDFFKSDCRLHHLLYTISPQDPKNIDGYLNRYPGDDYVDILGIDSYSLWDQKSVSELSKILFDLTEVARQRGKVTALTEVGIENIPIAKWWTNYLLRALKNGEYPNEIAWALVWRNESLNHHFGPFLGHSSQEDFLRFFQDPATFFLSDIKKSRINK